MRLMCGDFLTSRHANPFHRRQAAFDRNTLHGPATVQWHKVARFAGAFAHGWMQGSGVYHGTVPCLAPMLPRIDFCPALNQPTVTPTHQMLSTTALPLPAESYRYFGTFHRGRPLPDDEAAYLFVALDRSAVAATAAPADAAAAGAAGAKGKAAKPPAKGAVADGADRVRVALGGEIGRLVVRAGLQVRLRPCVHPRRGRVGSAQALLLPLVVCACGDACHDTIPPCLDGTSSAHQAEPTSAPPLCRQR